MEEALDSTVNTRVSSRVRSSLEDEARRRQVNPLSLARTLLDESLRRLRHPGIGFRDGPDGRRAAIEGRRLDVWQVMETVWASDGKIDESADYLKLRPDQVQSAVGYYAEFSDEIDEQIARNKHEADRERAAWVRQQAALTR